MDTSILYPHVEYCWRLIPQQRETLEWRRRKAECGPQIDAQRGSAYGLYEAYSGPWGFSIIVFSTFLDQLWSENNFPHKHCHCCLQLELWDHMQSCSLIIADRGRLRTQWWRSTNRAKGAEWSNFQWRIRTVPNSVFLDCERDVTLHLSFSWVFCEAPLRSTCFPNSSDYQNHSRVVK